MRDDDQPRNRPWGEELEAENLELALSVLDHLVPAVVQMHRADAARLGLDPTELCILDVLRVVAPLSVAALAGRCSLSHAAASRAVGRLAAKDWVDRSMDPDDGRGWLVALTRRSRAALDDARADVRHELAEVGASLGPERRGVLLHASIQVTDRVWRSVRRQTGSRSLETRYRRRQERDRKRSEVHDRAPES